MRLQFWGLFRIDPSEPEGEQDMAKLLTATGLLLGLMMVGELAYGASAGEPRTPLECSTTILGDIVSCNESGLPAKPPT